MCLKSNPFKCWRSSRSTCMFPISTQNLVYEHEEQFEPQEDWSRQLSASLCRDHTLFWEDHSSAIGKNIPLVIQIRVYSERWLHSLKLRNITIFYDLYLVWLHNNDFKNPCRGKDINTYTLSPPKMVQSTEISRAWRSVDAVHIDVSNFFISNIKNFLTLFWDVYERLRVT